MSGVLCTGQKQVQGPQKEIVLGLMLIHGNIQKYHWSSNVGPRFDIKIPGPRSVCHTRMCVWCACMSGFAASRQIYARIQSVNLRYSRSSNLPAPAASKETVETYLVSSWHETKTVVSLISITLHKLSRATLSCLRSAVQEGLPAAPIRRSLVQQLMIWDRPTYFAIFSQSLVR